MATRKYGISRGESVFEITEGTGSATTDDLELTFDLADNLTQADVLALLEQIKMHIMSSSKWPPA